MGKMYVLYNPISGNQCGDSKAKNLSEYYRNKDLEYKDITTIDNYETIFNALSADDEVVICGGDGTLNRFVNGTYHLKLRNNVFYYATGSGNDFLRDICKNEADKEKPVQINDYIRNLPAVDVNGKTYRFVNGVGYGIDGYCCEVGEELRKKGKKPDYTGIAIKGLLFHYKPCNVTVTVDGKKRFYKKVWLAPTMFGRYYGGGMIPAPEQSRNEPEKGVSVMVMHKSGKLGTLCIFPSIFSGKHVKYQKSVEVLRGNDITVEFDSPRTLQIDGETVMNVTKYTAHSAVLAKKS